MEKEGLSKKEAEKGLLEYGLNEIKDTSKALYPRFFLGRLKIILLYIFFSLR